METALLTLSCVKTDPLRPFLTSTGQKPTIIIINRRNNMITVHQPSLFPSGHLQVMCGHKCRHVVRAVGMNGGDENDGTKKARGVMGASAVLACVIGAMCFTRPMCRPALAGWPFGTPKTETEVAIKVETKVEADAESTLATLMHWDELEIPKTPKEAKAKAQEKAQAKFYERVSRDNVDPADLKEAVRELAFRADGAKAGEALKELRERYEILSNSKDKKQEARNFGLALVEMLIYQKKYDDARGLAEELDKKSGSGAATADPKLYKVVVSLMSDQNNSYKLWKEFVDNYMQEPVAEAIIQFPEFQRRMVNLKAKLNERM